ncbi:MAG: triose-phosphate isomerase [Bacteroidota bacterium]
MKKVVAGNWKMNLTHKEALQLFDSLINEASAVPEAELIIAPPAVYLAEFSSRLSPTGRLKLAAQNVHFMPSGAFTGEISAQMLASIGLEYCIIGHSERRQYFGETDDMVGKKAMVLLENGITPIICVGEQLDERYNNNQFDVVKRQTLAALENVSDENSARVIMAYEPVWAIGTGQTATSEQAQEMHSFIRVLLTDLYGSFAADNIPILYGGSCNAQNAKELFAQPDVNGGLIGGASLKAADFLNIAVSF